MAMVADKDIESALIAHKEKLNHLSIHRCDHRFITITTALITSGLLFFLFIQAVYDGTRVEFKNPIGNDEKVESEVGVVATDSWLCSEIGASMLKAGGHAVDAVVATAICTGLVHPMASGIGGGAFILVKPSREDKGVAFDCRETAPMASSPNMYESNLLAKSEGVLSIAIPGEIAGLYAAWSKYGKLPWRSLFLPSIKLARYGFRVERYLSLSITKCADKILAIPGLRRVFAPNGKLLELNDTCYNPELANTLEVIATEGPKALYHGSIGEKLVAELRSSGGIMTLEDLRRYKVKVTEAMSANLMGYKVLGMPPPSSGTVGLSLVLNILGSYGTLDAVRGLLGLHRLIEAVKHMLAYRMNLGDPDFVNISQYVGDMLSPSFAEKLRHKIVDNTTFDPNYYLPRWNQIRDHGTGHISVVDAERNAVSMTSTLNYYFGSKVLSQSTGIILNNEMDDFSAPTEAIADGLPPSPENFIQPDKRPLSSMTPLIILKDNQLVGVLGASGGINIVVAVIQVFLNHFVLGMKPLEAVQYPRFYHTLIPNEVKYENCTVLDGEHIEFSEEAKEFLEQRNHRLRSIPGERGIMMPGATAVCQFIVHNLKEPISDSRRHGGVFRGLLTAVSDPRSNGRPAGI